MTRRMFPRIKKKKGILKRVKSEKESMDSPLLPQKSNILFPIFIIFFLSFCFPKAHKVYFGHL